MVNKEQYRQYIIGKLNGYGIFSGPNGEHLQTWDYYEIRSYLSLEEIKRDEDTLRSA
ncbi:hypothetical protein [Planomicrobium okeanokoites]|uniref:hypothetical protein n=1 Tax=Planomicrobium okeanokoites TaxID=244 RepID=UPI0015C48690|nr:hypothetical protein [Planomicrobium okeanokoites]